MPDKAASQYPNALFILAALFDDIRAEMALSLADLGVKSANVASISDIKEYNERKKANKLIPRKSIGNRYIF